MPLKLTPEVCSLLGCSPTALSNWLSRYPQYRPAKRVQTAFLWTDAEIERVRVARSGGRPRTNGSRVLVDPGEIVGRVSTGADDDDLDYGEIMRQMADEPIEAYEDENFRLNPRVY